MDNAQAITCSTFGITAETTHAVSASSRQEVAEAVRHAKENSLQIRPVGEGSNTVLAETTIKQYLLHVDITGQEIIKETTDSVWLKIGAGENWDDVVEQTVTAGWSGVAALSAIPGAVGAAPVQNIGAYGQELADVLTKVTAFDTKKQKVVTLDKRGCEFGYRDSYFKQNPGRLIILSVTIQLSKQAPSVPDYTDVKEYFANHSITNPSAQQIREAIRKIRWSKLPKPSETPNVGSFFKNPVVDEKRAKDLQDMYIDMPTYDTDKGVKIPAGWLIEEVGLKGEWFSTVGVCRNNALVLVSQKQANFSDLACAVGEIRQRVRDQFGIAFEREPRILY